MLKQLPIAGDSDEIGKNISSKEHGPTLETYYNSSGIECFNVTCIGTKYYLDCRLQWILVNRPLGEWWSKMQNFVWEVIGFTNNTFFILIRLNRFVLKISFLTNIVPATQFLYFHSKRLLKMIHRKDFVKSISTPVLFQSHCPTDYPSRSLCHVWFWKLFLQIWPLPLYF